MSSKVKVLNLLLDDGTLDGLLTVQDSKWQNGQLFSCPRDNVSALLENESTRNFGVYLLLSRKKVYVGQSTDLKQRVEQHIVGKDWWERVIMLTTTDDSFDHTAIDYVESVLIEKSVKAGTLDSDNKNKGNKPKVDPFKKAVLDEYIEEALFILELIGVDVFSDKKKVSTSGIEIVPPSPNQEQLDLRQKSEVIAFVQKKGIKIHGYVTYAKRQIKKSVFWNNGQVSALKDDWTFILNDQFKKVVMVLNIPKNAFQADDKSLPNYIYVRNDKTYYMDLNLDSETLIDKRSGADFSPFIAAKLNYS